jgi:hypothetical protein
MEHIKIMTDIEYRNLISIIENKCKPNRYTLKIHNYYSMKFIEENPEEYKQLLIETNFVENGFTERYRVLKNGWSEYPKCENPDCNNKIKNSQKRICGNKCSNWLSLKTMNEKYNTNYTNLMHLPEILKKQKTNIKKAYENKEVLEKRKKTNLKKYGYDHHTQNPDQIQKIKSQLIKNQGGIGAQSTKISKKMKETNLKKYGTEYPTQSKEILEKIKETNIKKYGVKCVLQSKKIKEYIKRSNLKKYGVENVFENNDIKLKIKETNLKKYGYENPSSAKKIKDKKRKTFEESNKWLKIEQKTDFEHYSSLVDSITKKQEIKSLKNSENRGQFNYHLDHKFSKYEGFKQNIPPYIVGGIKNLEFIKWSENLIKNRKCSTVIDDIIPL